MIVTASFLLSPLETIKPDNPDIFCTNRDVREPLSWLKINLKSFQNQKAERSINSSLRFARNGPGGIRTPDTVVRSHVL